MTAFADEKWLKQFCVQITSRIQLRLIDSHDTDKLFGLIDSNRSHLRSWHPWVDAVRSPQDAGRMISQWEDQIANNRGFCAVILFDRELCGVIHHLNVDWQNRWTALSYWLDVEHQGRGIMTLCCRALVIHAFAAWNLNRVTIECAAENIRSRAIPERLGFKLEGMVRSAERMQDHYVDHAIYGLLRSECRFMPAQKEIQGSANDREKAIPHSEFRIPNSPVSAFDQSLKLAFELHNAGRSEEAEALCRILEKICSGDSQLLFLLGMILHKKNQDTEAVQYLSQAAQHRPDSARIFKGLGCAFLGLKDHTRAAGAFERAIELQPESADGYYNLGKSCYRLDQVERACALFQRAVEINPRDANSWNNLGKCLKELNRLDDSIEAYNRAMEIAPDYALARHGRAISLLAAGRLTEGFQEYEWRWRCLTPRKLSQPVWHGERAPGKTLFIHAEQGFGDAIQMARFVRLARERVGRVILECRPELTRLFQYSNCADVVVPYGSPNQLFDRFIPMLSLPRVLGVSHDNIPAESAYLRAPVCEKMPSAPLGHLKVGIAWAGSPNHHHDAARSLLLEALSPIFQVPGIAFYSLQHTVPSRDCAFLDALSNSGMVYPASEPESSSTVPNNRTPILPLLGERAALSRCNPAKAEVRVGSFQSGHETLASPSMESLPNITTFAFQDFLETASVIRELDLVIAADTAVSHLAGALGKPVWLLLQHSPDWRWFLNRDDTPWYPNMRLFRQAQRNDWTNLIARVAEALRRESCSHRE